ncbi:unnamed protein product [Bursaphelenchus okinawaensis]|uniref:Peptide-methionine (R)-S-oxide reductase n=1 Tax=Bursaphelenchus okinawaensis TaxID=465554 RepID=A0A811K8V6_9BILA|nr:unnamed protein product [Bursaphelenchus okinawaensis]CAG9094384.1 unnamed protein product [Bursaphelenchus okinawaensis]
MVADESRIPKIPVVTQEAAVKKLLSVYPTPADVPEEEWAKVLTPEEFFVCRQAGTEPSFSGVLTKHFAPGKYSCRCCGADLFVSDSKYWSGCGWPAFSESVGEDKNIIRIPDTRFNLNRTEVKCKKCNAHLGHVFDDPAPETGERYCINSVSINFEEAEKAN